MTVTFTSRLSAAAAPLKHAWEHVVGSSRALLDSAGVGIFGDGLHPTSLEQMVAIDHPGNGPIEREG